MSLLKKHEIYKIKVMINIEHYSAQKSKFNVSKIAEEYLFSKQIIFVILFVRKLILSLFWKDETVLIMSQN